MNIYRITHHLLFLVYFPRYTLTRQITHIAANLVICCRSASVRRRRRRRQPPPPAAAPSTRRLLSLWPEKQDTKATQLAYQGPDSNSSSPWKQKKRPSEGRITTATYLLGDTCCTYLLHLRYIPCGLMILEVHR